MTPDIVSQAVRKLRIALKESQQAFAYRLNTAVRTVARYESNRPPTGKALAQLEIIAAEHGFEDHAAVFRAALARDLGRNPVGIPAIVPIVNFRNDEEKRWVCALLRSMRAPAHSRHAEAAKRALRIPEQDVQSRTAAAEFYYVRVALLVRMAGQGKTPEEIANALDWRKEQVADILAIPEVKAGSTFAEAYLATYISGSILSEAVRDVQEDTELPVAVIKFREALEGLLRQTIEKGTEGNK